MKSNGQSLLEDLKQKKNVAHLRSDKVATNSNLSLLNEAFKKKQVFAMKTKKGHSQAASLKLLFNKLGITQEELKAINENSLTRCQSLAKKFKKLSEETKVDYAKLLENSIFYPKPGQTLHTAEQPYTLPQTPVDDFIFSSNVYQHGHIHAEGDGDGILTREWGGNADQYDQFAAVYKFTFIPPYEGFYDFDALVLCAGPYYLIADDGACDSKEARCSVEAGIVVYQELPGRPPGSTYTYVYDRNDKTLFMDADDNINKIDSLIGIGNMKVEGVYLYANVPVAIEVTVDCSVMGKGGGSVADMNLSQTTGAVACPGLSIKSA